MSELIDNRERRVQTLERIIKQLHQGASPDLVEHRLRELVKETTSDEIVAMEQQLMERGMTSEEIAEMCDLHSQVLRSVLQEEEGQNVPAGHPVDTFRRENAAIADAVDEMRELLDRLESSKDASEQETLLERWRTQLEQLVEVEQHYARKENLLFPYLERHGISGPSQVMWAKDDEIRQQLRALRRALADQHEHWGGWAEVARKIARPMLSAISEMIYKEEKILLPMSLQNLSEQEWGEVYEQSPQFGYTLVRPRAGYEPPVETESAPAAPDAGGGTRVRFGVGSVTPEQLEAIGRALPVDLTFVDADDRVGFFSNGPDRVFERAPAIIGRQVQNCHPPGSVHVVEQILDDFKNGRQDVAEFWIQLKGRFVHIRYFAVRNEAGEYLGTLEVTQDATQLRELSGERRLLQYDRPARTGS
jgi:hypothetical protein